MAEMMDSYEHRQMDDGRYAYKGVGNAGLTTGIIGTALGVLNGGLGLMGGMNNGWGRYHNGYGGYGYAPEAMCIDRPVGRETFELQQKVSALEAERSLLKSESDTEVKIADAYSRLKGDSLDQERLSNAKWTEQLVWNARMESRMAVAESKIDQLMGMTRLYVEASRVTPLPMDRYNSWTAPTAP